MNIDLTSNDRHMIAYALQLRINIIETGDPVMSANDARNCGMHEKIRALSPEQYKAIVEHHDLIRKVLKSTLPGFST